MSIQAQVQARGIKVLLHFTRAANLQNILTHGLIPRDQLAVRGLAPVCNDDVRLDGCSNANCLSISFPNYRMFYPCRQRDLTVDWVVLVIAPSVLWTKDCAFCVENAASNAVTAIPLNDRRTEAAFARMFAEYPGKPTRAAMGIADHRPTNPQAEVLVLEHIEPQLIGAVAFRSQAVLNANMALANGRQMELIPGLFGPRADYLHWK